MEHPAKPITVRRESDLSPAPTRRFSKKSILGWSIWFLVALLLAYLVDLLGPHR